MNVSFINKFTTVLACLILFSSCNCRTSARKNETDTPKASQLKPVIARTISHDPTSFTQGLFIHNGRLYECTGLYGKSRVMILDIMGTQLLSRPLENNYFGEGWTLHRNSIYHITWREERCFLYNPENLWCTDTLTYSGEGWGITSDGTSLYMSNGSDTLYKRNSTFGITGKIPVTFSGKPLYKLNELEFARGFIYANVWFSDFIFEIDPHTGRVTRTIDCSLIVAEEKPVSDQAVLNGIAYDQKSALFYITGKNWRNIFVVEIK